MQIDEVVARTDIGRIRAHNEDSHLLMEDLGLLAVADGMGGLEQGDLASATAIATLQEAREPLQKLLTTAQQGPGALGRVQVAQALDMLPHVVNDRIQHVTGGHQSGTTLVAGLISDGHFLISHVGDSRAYLYRDGALRRLTDDQTVAAAQLKSGLISQEEHDRSPYQHMLYQALGTAGQVDPDILCEPLAGGDLLLLCSDGLTGPLSDTDIEDLLAETKDLTEAADALIEQANHAGGPDNITIVLARTASGPDATEIDSHRQVLEDCSILKGLDERQRSMLWLYLDEFSFFEGHTFESHAGLHLLLSGQVQVTGGEALHEGRVFGLTPFADGGEAIAQVSASTDGRVAVLSRGCFAMLKDRRPQLAAHILQGLLSEVARRNREP